jgi:hypothetical protein
LRFLLIFFLENAISLSASICRNEARFGKHLWGPLVAPTVDTLLAAMCPVRAFHLHCRRIVFTSTTLKDSVQSAPRWPTAGIQIALVGPGGEAENVKAQVAFFSEEDLATLWPWGPLYDVVDQHRRVLQARRIPTKTSTGKIFRRSEE